MLQSKTTNSLRWPIALFIALSSPAVVADDVRTPTNSDASYFSNFTGDLKKLSGDRFYAYAGENPYFSLIREVGPDLRIGQGATILKGKFRETCVRSCAGVGDHPFPTPGTYTDLNQTTTPSDARAYLPDKMSPDSVLGQLFCVCEKMRFPQNSTGQWYLQLLDQARARAKVNFENRLHCATPTACNYELY